MKKAKKILFAILFTLLFTSLSVTTAMAATRTVTLSQNKWYTNTTQSYNDTYYYKISVPKTGYITVSGYCFSKYSNNKYTLRVQLCNSRKKELEKYKTSLYETRGFKTYYAVKKGTYYLKVSDSNYKLKYTFKAITEKSGTTASSAVTIPKNKSIAGLALAGESGKKIDYYKIRLTKPQRINFTFGAKANDWIKFKLVPANPKQYIIGSTVYRWYTTEKASTKDVFPAGTYYIQVSRMTDDTDTSGVYTIKWN